MRPDARKRIMNTRSNQHPNRRGIAVMDMKLEVVVLPVSDVDKAKGFYQGLGWRLDADFAKSEDFR